MAWPSRLLGNKLGASRSSQSRNNPHSVEDYDEYVYQSITDFIPYRDNFVDTLFFAAGYMDDEQTRERIGNCLGRVLEFTDRPESVTSWSDSMYDNYRFIAYEGAHEYKLGPRRNPLGASAA